MPKVRRLKDTSKDPLAKEAFVKGEGKAEKASELPMLNVRAKAEVIKRVKIACAHEDLTMQEFVNQAVEAKLKELGY